MGVNKAFLEFEGRTLLERAIVVVSAACGTSAIVGDPTVLERYGRVIPDLYAGCGPLGGIHAALQHSSAELNLMLAVDMPFVSANLLGFLLEAAESSGAVVTVPQTGRGFQPLCAVYRREFASLAEQALRAGKYKIDRLFCQTAVRIITEGELSVAGFTERDFLNVNTPEELESVRSKPI